MMTIDTDTPAQGRPAVANTPTPAAAASRIRSKTHHFIFYNEASYDNVAAFSAAKVLLEAAIADEREMYHHSPARISRSSRREHYLVRLLRDGEMTMNSKGADFDLKRQLLGTMSIHEFDQDATAEFAATKRVQRSIKVTIRPAENASANMPAPANLAARAPGIFDFTVVDGKVTHCLWTASPEVAE